MTLIIQKPTGAKVVLAQAYVEGDRNFSNVSLLLHGDGTNGSTTITDSSPTPKTVTAFGNAQISTAQSKFGGASIAFDGTGDYATVPSNAGWGFGTGEFTVEAWVYRATPAPLYASLVSVGYGTNGIGIAFQSNNDIIITRPNTAVDHTFAANVGVNAWQHVAIVRSGSSLFCYANGTQIGAGQANTLNYAQDRLVIGADGNTISQTFNGYIDDLRITKGVARYTANFTPPTAPFVDAQF